MTQAQTDCCALLELMDFCSKPPLRDWQIGKKGGVGFIVRIADVEGVVETANTLSRAILDAIARVKGNNDR
jgi:hypothetical protein